MSIDLKDWGMADAMKHIEVVSNNLATPEHQRLYFFKSSGTVVKTKSKITLVELVEKPCALKPA